jgi:hypothetical protein
VGESRRRTHYSTLLYSFDTLDVIDGVQSKPEWSKSCPAYFRKEVVSVQFLTQAGQQTFRFVPSTSILFACEGRYTNDC